MKIVKPTSFGAGIAVVPRGILEHVRRDDGPDAVADLAHHRRLLRLPTLHDPGNHVNGSETVAPPRTSITSLQRPCLRVGAFPFLPDRAT